jgi:hypothetical protein
LKKINRHQKSRMMLREVPIDAKLLAGSTGPRKSGMRAVFVKLRLVDFSKNSFFLAQ